MAADRGHQITLFERDSVLGGSCVIRFCFFSSGRCGTSRDYLIRRVEKRPIDGG